MCDSNNDVFDQIHTIAAHLFSELTGDMSNDKVKKLRHGLNLIISLSGFMDNVVTQEDLVLLGMGGHEHHHPDDHEHSHEHQHLDGHSHSHKHPPSDEHSHTHPHSDKHDHSHKHHHSDEQKHSHEH